MSKPCHFFFQNKNETYIFTINKPNIIKQSKYFHCFIVCVLVPSAFWFSFQQNKGTVVIGDVFSDEALMRGEALTLMWVVKGAALI